MFIRALAIALLLVTAPALADVTGTAQVIDGDTLEIDGQRIRLHGIDAPEARQFCRRDGKPWQCGKDAMNTLAGKISRRPIACQKRDRDRNGCIVAVCYAGGDDLNAWMVANGWALAYRQYSLHYVDEEADAQAVQRGIWGSEFVRPWDWRRGKRLDSAGSEPCTACDARHRRLLKRSEKCTIKGNINRNGERIYHMGGVARLVEYWRTGESS